MDQMSVENQELFNEIDRIHDEKRDEYLSSIDGKVISTVEKKNNLEEIEESRRREKEYLTQKITLEKRSHEKGLFKNMLAGFGNKDIEKVEAAIEKLRKEREKEYNKILEEIKREQSESLHSVGLDFQSGEGRPLSPEEIRRLEKFNFLISVAKKKKHELLMKLYENEIPKLERDITKFRDEVLLDLRRKLQEIEKRIADHELNVRNMRAIHTNRVPSDYQTQAGSNSPYRDQLRYVLGY